MDPVRHLITAFPVNAFRPRTWCIRFLLGCFLLGPASRGSANDILEQTNAGPVQTNYSTKLSDAYGIGWWIWTNQTFDQQTCRFWRSFEVPRSGVINYARIRMTADNSYRLFLDGREIGKGGEWRSLNEYNVTSVLGPGPHTLAVEAFSDYGPAGIVFGLHIELSSGRVMEILSDEKWRIIPDTEKHWDTVKRAEASWPVATVIAPFGEASWKQASARILQGPPLHPIIIRFWQTAWFQITLITVCAIAILISFYSMSQLASQSKAQQFLQRERVRIARDIHDDVGARLSHLVLLGERAQRTHSSNPEARAQFDQICEQTREVLGAIDEVVWTVNSRRDTVRDFETYVCNYAETFLQSTAIRCRSEVDADIREGSFDLAIRRNLFLAIKEAINNAAKYSQATELFLRIRLQGNELIVVVEDNGKGFNPARANRSRNGLSNMTQRIIEVGGNCKITSSAGQGCRIEFRTPLVHSRDSSPWWNRFGKSKPAGGPLEEKEIRVGAIAES